MKISSDSVINISQQGSYIVMMLGEDGLEDATIMAYLLTLGGSVHISIFVVAPSNWYV